MGVSLNSQYIGLIAIFLSLTGCKYNYSTRNTSATLSDSTVRSSKVIAEFEKSSYVLISGQLDSGIANPLGASLERQGVQLITVGYKNNSQSSNTTWLKDSVNNMSQWTRDWGPISVDENGKNKFISFMYRDNESSANAVDLVAKHLNRKHQRASLSISENSELPFTFEGGNFMTDGKDCVMSDKPVRDALANIHKDSIQSQLSQVSRDKLEQKYESIIAQLLSTEEAKTVADSIGDYFKTNMGCERVIITEKAPHEDTNHIDLWAKFIAEKTVLVHYIPEKRFREVAPSLNSKRLEKLTQVKQFLDNQIKNMESYGYKVIPVKMPIPMQANIRTYYSDTEWKDVDLVLWLSYLNTLFLLLVIIQKLHIYLNM